MIQYNWKIIDIENKPQFYSIYAVEQLFGNVIDEYFDKLPLKKSVSITPPPSFFSWVVPDFKVHIKKCYLMDHYEFEIKLHTKKAHYENIVGKVSMNINKDELRQLQNLFRIDKSCIRNYIKLVLHKE